MAGQRLSEYLSDHYIFRDTIVVCVPLLIIFLSIYLWRGDLLAQDFSNWVISYGYRLFPYIATISGALIGFIITSISIISGFLRDERSRVSSLRDKPISDYIFAAFFHAIIALGITMVMTLVGSVSNGPLATWLFIFIAFAIAVTMMRLFRCLWILSKLTKGNSMEKKDPSIFDKSRS